MAFQIYMTDTPAPDVASVTQELTFGTKKIILIKRRAKSIKVKQKLLEMVQVTVLIKY